MAFETYNRKVQEFNQMADRASKLKDFDKIKDFAYNEFFKQQTESRKLEIAIAMEKMKHQCGSREDIQTMIDYWKQAVRVFSETAR